MTRNGFLSLGFIASLAACDSGDANTDASSTTTGASTTSPAATGSTTLEADTTSSGAESSEATGSSGTSSEATGSSGGNGSTGSTGSTGSNGSTGSTGSTGSETSEACFEGGTPAPAPTGAGTCASPFVVDLSAQAHGTIVTVDLAGGGDEMDMGGGGGCLSAPEGTARDVVVHVMMPSDVTGLLVSVDPTSGADPRIAVAEDPSCFQPMNACADELGTDACEGLLAPRGGDGFFGVSTYVVLSETVDSGETLTVRFQTTDA